MEEEEIKEGQKTKLTEYSQCRVCTREIKFRQETVLETQEEEEEELCLNAVSSLRHIESKFTTSRFFYHRLRTHNQTHTAISAPVLQVCERPPIAR